ncbi:MAG: Hpt domain-containing protein [Gemmobacter sp.]|jgi:HPt (histidine-containing phosphotransfer) domain-containing protein|nr:Hpt domain-containing protein [Gemmobacter sp.]
MIDWDRVSDLRSEIGEEGFTEVIALFLEETDEVIARLTGTSGGHLGSDLHFLKGSALNLGFRELAALCQEGERHCNAGQAGIMDLAPLLQLYRDSKAAFETGLRQPSAA